jgi:hypothetical protein
MSAISDYKARVSRDGSAKQNQINHTKKMITNDFANSPSYKEVYINNNIEVTGVWITTDSTNPNEKKIIMQPINSINSGDLITDGTDKWLVVLAEKENPIYESGSIEKCNAVATFVTGETKTQDGTDSMGRPIYTVTPTTANYSCVVKSKTRISSQTDGAINIPDGRVVILMSYDVSLDVDILSEFELYSQTWKIVETDMTGVENDSGVFGISAERKG